MFKFAPRIIPLLAASFALACSAISAETASGGACAADPHYRVGVAIRDVTGPAAELGMMGYSLPEQKSAGISTRLWSRAFVIEHPCSGTRIAFVSADLGQVFQSVHLEVLERLQKEFGNRYTLDNLALSATHTHSGPAGYSHYALYNLAPGGFDPVNYEAIVSGITASIIAADKNLDHGVIKIAQGTLLDANWNRSPQAYAKNPAAERNAHADEHQRNTDTQMTVLRFERTVQGELDGAPIGMINWFAAHGTSVSNQNRLISGDHKGLASYFMERHFKADYTSSAPFVAAFAQSDAGDASPSEVIMNGDTNLVQRPCGDGGDAQCDDLDNAAIHGSWQFQRALELWEQATERLQGPVAGEAAFIPIDNVKVAAAFTGNGEQTTCAAAIGLSLVAGAEDGLGLKFIKEGIDSGTVPSIIASAQDKTCHAEKSILVPVGRIKPFPWVPSALPAQVLRVGSLAIAAVPFEITTLSGSRMRKTVLERFAGTSIDKAVIAALSNGYGGYVTTREEYIAQHYEGASTYYGPWTLAAWQQEFAGIADALRNGQSVADKAIPLDLSDDQIIKTFGVIVDAPCVSPIASLCKEKFGDVVQAPPATASPGQRISVRFRGAHPRNDLRTGKGYVQIQRRGGDGVFVTVARDWDPETRFHWKRTNGAASPTSEVTIEWDIPDSAPTGTYRIVYNGTRKALDGTKSSITGTSPTFMVGSSH